MLFFLVVMTELKEQVIHLTISRSFTANIKARVLYDPLKK